MTEVELLFILSYLLVYMYLGINFLMIVLEHKITLSISNPNETIKQLTQILSSENNPANYKQARIYFWGSVFMLILGIVLMRLGYV